MPSKRFQSEAKVTINMKSEFKPISAKQPSCSFFLNDKDEICSNLTDSSAKFVYLWRKIIGIFENYITEHGNILQFFDNNRSVFTRKLEFILS